MTINKLRGATYQRTIKQSNNHLKITNYESRNQTNFPI